MASVNPDASTQKTMTSASPPASAPALKAEAEYRKLLGEFVEKVEGLAISHHLATYLHNAELLVEDLEHHVHDLLLHMPALRKAAKAVAAASALHF